jgi:hypothetical protein
LGANLFKIKCLIVRTERLTAGFFRLSFADQRLLMLAVLAVVCTKVGITTFGIPAARATVMRLKRLTRILVPAAGADRAVWAIEAAGQAIPGMRNCLVQAIAAEAILAGIGYTCELRIGVAKTGPDELIAHAWLESDGKVLIGDCELDRFTPLARLKIDSTSDSASARRVSSNSARR